MGEEAVREAIKDTGDEFSSQSIRSAIKVAVRRMRLMTRGEVDPRAALHELSETVLPLLDDAMAVVEGLEEHASWASSEIDKLGDVDEDESQLTEEDADKFEMFLKAVRVEATSQLSGLDPDSEAAQRWLSLDDAAKELFELVDRIRLVDEDEVEGPAPNGDAGPEGDDDAPDGEDDE